ncbi:unnamed protein product [Caenorhabditis angaria]|uniref:Uncharacterized protein n=1 Tax=Caenorhabditis angaria TaxID=860376 RepID=A0A9P1J5L0_9PELO|nr:unnamed protein product [Caenorhabditis angaria]
MSAPLVANDEYDCSIIGLVRDFEDLSLYDSYFGDDPLSEDDDIWQNEREAKEDEEVLQKEREEKEQEELAACRERPMLRGRRKLKRKKSYDHSSSSESESEDEETLEEKERKHIIRIELIQRNIRESLEQRKRQRSESSDCEAYSGKKECNCGDYVLMRCSKVGYVKFWPRIFVFIHLRTFGRSLASSFLAHQFPSYFDTIVAGVCCCDNDNIFSPK